MLGSAAGVVDLVGWFGSLELCLQEKVIRLISGGFFVFVCLKESDGWVHFAVEKEKEKEAGYSPPLSEPRTRLLCPEDRTRSRNRGLEGRRSRVVPAFV